MPGHWMLSKLHTFQFPSVIKNNMADMRNSDVDVWITKKIRWTKLWYLLKYM